MSLDTAFEQLPLFGAGIRRRMLISRINMTFYSGKHKSQKINDRKDQGSSSAIVSAESPDKKTASDTNVRKGTNRVVPAYRRSKVRGAILNDTEDDA
ncbi:hypothetical protein SASPL_133496 [Salvia splendens]|uniref:Uncharacterized protein n=1 Tax=Salvia splendens TaxID=180675 RepID=A0A8X8ZI38_SALSN|nr:hypothetical protein SASPL_133496 [Salvia splendens]